MNTALRAGSLLLLLLGSAAPASAFDFIVTRYNDPAPDGCLPDDCSLREAVIAANATSDADRILLSAGVYTLTLFGSNEDFAAAGDLDLRESVEILGVAAGVTILDAAALGEQAIAAALPGRVYAIRRLTVRHSVTSGIFLGPGIQTIEDFESRDNGSNSGHHGILSGIGSVATLRRVSLVGNSGSGLSATQNSTIVENSTFSGNGTFDISLSTMVDFSCNHCTLYDPTDSDPEFKAINSPTLSIANSIVAGNCNLTSSTLTSLGGNVESAGNTCGFGQPTDLNSVTTVALDLGALTGNGGATPTHLPGAASVAVGNALDALCLTTDQRGAARTTDCESGAVELTALPVATPLFLDGFLQGNTGAWSDAIE
ncbi:MAG: choice-of-anchor Q domain-containing protein [Thermoanaerobaculia bacterium]